jgi:uncharacterized protein Smg (DUF494 family)
MIATAIIIALAVALQIYVIARLVRNYNKHPLKSRFPDERQKFYNHMERLGFKDWEIYEALKDVHTYSDLIQANNRLKKSLETYNL